MSNLSVYGACFALSTVLALGALVGLSATGFLQSEPRLEQPTLLFDVSAANITEGNNLVLTATYSLPVNGYTVIFYANQTQLGTNKTVNGVASFTFQPSIGNYVFTGAVKR